MALPSGAPTEHLAHGYIMALQKKREKEAERESKRKSYAKRLRIAKHKQRAADARKNRPPSGESVRVT